MSGLICGLMQRQEFLELPELCFEPAIYEMGSMASRLGKCIRNMLGTDQGKIYRKVKLIIC